MSTVLALELGSAVVGSVIGFNYRVHVIALVSPIIAVAAAIALRRFDFVAAVVITLASLLANQLAYLIGAWLRTRSIAEHSDNAISGKR